MTVVPFQVSVSRRKTVLKNKGQVVVCVVLFARVSTKPQAAEDRYSISAQLAEMRESCAQKVWRIVGEIVEVISGKATIRVKLKELLALVCAGAVDVVLVHELSRLSRSVYQTLHVFAVLGENNVGFASVKDPDFDFTDPS
jgi:DNA invertase Pin-like site-specific DNA recombinase